MHDLVYRYAISCPIIILAPDLNIRVWTVCSDLCPLCEVTQEGKSSSLWTAVDSLSRYSCGHFHRKLLGQFQRQFPATLCGESTRGISHPKEKKQIPGTTWPFDFYLRMASESIALQELWFSVMVWRSRLLFTNSINKITWIFPFPGTPILSLPPRRYRP